MTTLPRTRLRRPSWAAALAGALLLAACSQGAGVEGREATNSASTRPWTAETPTGGAGTTTPTPVDSEFLFRVAAPRKARTMGCRMLGWGDFARIDVAWRCPDGRVYYKEPAEGFTPGPRSLPLEARGGRPWRACREMPDPVPWIVVTARGQFPTTAMCLGEALESARRQLGRTVPILDAFEA